MPPDTHPDQPRDGEEGWGTLKRFLPYLWPRDRRDLRLRIVAALVLVVLAKAIALATPLAMKTVVDSMAGDAGAPGNDALMWVALTFVIAFVAGRFLGTAF